MLPNVCSESSEINAEFNTFPAPGARAYLYLHWVKYVSSRTEFVVAAEDGAPGATRVLFPRKRLQVPRSDERADDFGPRRGKKRAGKAIECNKM